MLWFKSAYLSNYILFILRSNLVIIMLERQIIHMADYILHPFLFMKLNVFFFKENKGMVVIPILPTFQYLIVLM